MKYKLIPRYIPRNASVYFYAIPTYATVHSNKVPIAKQSPIIMKRK